MTELDFEFLRGFLKSRSGLSLTAEKRYLVESRLGPVCRCFELESLSELTRGLKGGRDSDLEKAVIEAMTTNETFFFRDKSPFDLFRDVLLPRFLAARASTRRVRIWCAAASTGQEPYSLAMLLTEAAPRHPGWQFEIVATDISVEVLEKAKAGLYSQFEVQRGLPIQLLVKHFTQINETWQLSPDIRAMVQFKQLNLLHDFSHLGVFDVIFCRNVLIYFDQDTKVNVFNHLARVIEPDGFLVLGAAETVVGLSAGFSPYPERRGLYHPSVAKTASPSIVPMAGAGRAAAAAR